MEREARKPHKPQSPSHAEFVTAIPQEYGSWDQEEAISREDPDSQRVRGGEYRYRVELEKEKGSRRSTTREAGDKEWPEEQPGALREGQYSAQQEAERGGQSAGGAKNGRIRAPGRDPHRTGPRDKGCDLPEERRRVPHQDWPHRPFRSQPSPPEKGMKRSLGPRTSR